MKTAQRYFLGKESKLKSTKQIQQVFATGKHLTMFPVKAIWLQTQHSHPLQAGFSVSARHFKKAVDRNRIKRLMRESYRLQKNALEAQLLENNIQLAVFFIFTDTTLPSYATMYEAMGKLIQKLIRIQHENHQPNS